MKFWTCLLPVVTGMVIHRQNSNSSYSEPDYKVAPVNFDNFANGSLFATWRPRAKVLPPDNQIGDPCALYSDPNTGLFHPGFLFSNASDDRQAGIASVSTDNLVTYKDLRPDPPSIRFGAPEDPIAIFDGSVIERGVDGHPTLFYTSVSALPIHWTIPYTKNAESASLAVATNGGADFERVKGNPIIDGAPEGIDRTAFRDPYNFFNEQLDRQLGNPAGTLYATISGGVRDVGPAHFLFQNVDSTFQNWTYLGEFWSEPANSTWGDGTWAARWGFNFEVGNVFESQGETFFTAGAEWGYAPVPIQTSPERSMLWAQGKIAIEESSGLPKFHVEMAGRSDWGKTCYAAAGKKVASTSQPSQKSGAGERFILYHWLYQDNFPTAKQGWKNTLVTPREVGKGYIKNVVNNQLVGEVASWKVESEDPIANTVTLGIFEQKIAREPYHAFQTQAQHTFTEAARIVTRGESTPFTQLPSSKFYMLTTKLQFPCSARTSDTKAGLKILSSQYESTTIYYQFSNESLIVDRSNSTAAALVNQEISNQTFPETGRLRLFDLWDAETQSIQMETLDLTIIVDGSVVEVFLNNRFALSTWVWAWYDASNGIEFFTQGENVQVTFGETTIHEGLVNAWPERPVRTRQ